MGDKTAKGREADAAVVLAELLGGDPEDYRPECEVPALEDQEVLQTDHASDAPNYIHMDR